MFVQDAMTGNVRSCNSNCDLEDAARQMWECDCGAIPVVDENEKPIGIITDRDITMASMLKHKPLWELKASSVIADQNLVVCHLNDKLEDCLKTMQDNTIRRLPVVNDMGFLSGILSMGDLIALTAEKSTKAKQSNFLSFSDVIGMLKGVSAHHREPDMPIT